MLTSIPANNLVKPTDSNKLFLNMNLTNVFYLNNIIILGSQLGKYEKTVDYLIEQLSRYKFIEKNHLLSTIFNTQFFCNVSKNKFYNLIYNTSQVVSYLNNHSFDENQHNMYINAYELLCNKSIELSKQYIGVREIIFKNINKTLITIDCKKCKNINKIKEFLNSILNTWKNIENIKDIYLLNLSEEIELNELYNKYPFIKDVVNDKSYMTNVITLFDENVDLKYWVNLNIETIFFIRDNYVEDLHEYFQFYNINQIVYNKIKSKTFINNNSEIDIFEPISIFDIEFDNKDSNDITIKDDKLQNKIRDYYQELPSINTVEFIKQIYYNAEKNNITFEESCNKLGCRSINLDRISCRNED